MAHISTFDTFQFIKKLQKVGVPEQQAEIYAEAFREQNEAVDDFIENKLITKQDLKTELEKLVLILNLDNKILGLENRLLIKLGGLMLVGVTLLAFLMKFLRV